VGINEAFAGNLTHFRGQSLLNRDLAGTRRANVDRNQIKLAVGPWVGAGGRRQERS
jgi:hypothetical protein